MGASGSRKIENSSLLDNSDFPSYDRSTIDSSSLNNSENRLHVDTEYYDKSSQQQDFSGLRTNYIMHLAGSPRCDASIEKIYARKKNLLQRKHLIDMELRRIERDIINWTSHLDANNVNRRHSCWILESRKSGDGKSSQPPQTAKSRSHSCSLLQCHKSGDRKWSFENVLRGLSRNSLRSNFNCSVEMGVPLSPLPCLWKQLSVTDKIAQALNSGLHTAVGTGNVMEVHRLIKKKVDVNNQNLDGQTPTMWAALAGSEESLFALIRAKADIRIRDSHGRTALFFAACEGFEMGVELLLDAQHSEDTLGYPNLNGVTPLLTAVENGHHSAVSLLLKKHLEVLNSDIPLDVRRKKWKHDRRVDRRNIYGETPLMLAATQGDPTLTEILLKAKSDVNARDRWGYTSLTEAVELGNLECVKKLVASTADVDCVTMSNPRTVIRIAVEASNLGILSVLLGAKADPNIYALNYSCSPLHTACESPNELSIKVVRMLLQNEADVNARNNESGQTPLHIVSQQGHSELCELLINYGAEVSLEDNNRQTPLSLALNAGKATICIMLKRHGAKMPEPTPEYIHKFPRSSLKPSRKVPDFKRVLDPLNLIDCSPTIGDPICSVPFQNHKPQNTEKPESLHYRNSSFFYAYKAPAMNPGILDSPIVNLAKLSEGMESSSELEEIFV